MDKKSGNLALEKVIAKPASAHVFYALVKIAENNPAYAEYLSGLSEVKAMSAQVEAGKKAMAFRIASENLTGIMVQEGDLWKVRKEYRTVFAGRDPEHPVFITEKGELNWGKILENPRIAALFGSLSEWVSKEPEVIGKVMQEIDLAYLMESPLRMNAFSTGIIKNVNKWMLVNPQIVKSLDILTENHPDFWTIYTLFGRIPMERKTVARLFSVLREIKTDSEAVPLFQQSLYLLDQGVARGGVSPAQAAELIEKLLDRKNDSYPQHISDWIKNDFAVTVKNNFTGEPDQPRMEETVREIEKTGGDSWRGWLILGTVGWRTDKDIYSYLNAKAMEWILTTTKQKERIIDRIKDIVSPKAVNLTFAPLLRPIQFF